MRGGLNSEQIEFLTGRMSLVPGLANLAAPGLVIDFPKWMDAAVCAQTGPDPFFPEAGDWRISHQAKAICARCPVRAECLDWADENGDQYGIFGGLTDGERRFRRRARNVA